MISYAEIEAKAERYFAADHMPITAEDLATALEYYSADYDKAVAAGEDPWKVCVRLHCKYWFDECLAQAAAVVESEEFNRRAAA